MSAFESNERLILFHEEIKDYHCGLPYPGKRADLLPYTGEMKVMDDFFYMGNNVYGSEFLGREWYTFFDSGDAGPLLSDPYPVCCEWCRNIIENDEMIHYGFASGDLSCREKVAGYLTDEGFVTYPGESIKANQIIFTNSVTEAFSLVMKLICWPGDVVLFTAPTYGLLAYIPERLGAFSRFIPLRKENDWFVDPEELDALIKKINQEIGKSRKDPMRPRVVAFVNINPNNPLGNVMSRQHLELLKRIASVCRQNGVFIIDDLIYRELCFDVENRAFPIAAIDGEFDNTITFFGVSKSFGMPQARAGGIFANEVIIRGVRNEIFRIMDSTSLPVSYIMAGAFNDDPDKKEIFFEYMTRNVKKYKYNWNIFNSIINGDIERLGKNSYDTMREYFNESYFFEHEGVPYVELAEGIIPQSGFFAMLDFTKLLGKKVCSTRKKLSSEKDIVDFIYAYARVKILPGSSVFWPKGDTVVARFSFAFSERELIRMLGQIYNAIKENII